MNTLHSGSRGGKGAAAGGTFCQFTVGSGQRGASTRHLRYIANPQAVRDEREGVWLQGFPALLSEAPYPVLVGHLLDWSHWLEQEEVIRHRGRGEVRTHYQAILSFEQAVVTAQARQMLAHWMQEAFPLAQAAAFVHTNTRHLHVHVWIAARQTDGRKINLAARAYRQLDEKWNRIYSRALSRDEREHLLKKGQTERWKQLRREGRGEDLPRPERVGHGWNPADFTARERERLGDKSWEVAKGEYDRHETGTGSYQPQPAGRSSTTERAKHDIGEQRPPFARAAEHLQQAFKDAKQTVSEVERLHQDAQRVAPRPQQHERERKVEPERER